MAGETSIKGVIQSLFSEGLGIVIGVVIRENPLNIQLINDKKVVLNPNLLLVPTHLTNYKTTVDIELCDDSAIQSSTKVGQGTHGHGPSGDHSQYEGSGQHTHPETEGKHVHELSSFKLTAANMTVKNALKKDEEVYLLPIDKKYYVLDRVVSS